jgi:hypothetical protein
MYSCGVEEDSICSRLAKNIRMTGGVYVWESSTWVEGGALLRVAVRKFVD